MQVSQQRPAAPKKHNNAVDDLQNAIRRSPRTPWAPPTLIGTRLPKESRRARILVHDFGRNAEADLECLRGFFDAADLRWQPSRFSADGKRAQVVAHVSDTAILDRLDEVCGPANWCNTFEKGPNGGVVCGLSIRVADEWLTKWDTHEILPYTEGARVQPRSTNVRIRRVLGSGLRRAALQWGIGRYLDRLPAQWVPLDNLGRIARRPNLPPEFRFRSRRDGFDSTRLASNGRSTPVQASVQDRDTLPVAKAG